MKQFFTVTIILLLAGFSCCGEEYTYDSNGNDWEMAQCQVGQQQSPIDIYPIGEGCDTQMQIHVGFKQGTQSVTLKDLGHTIQANGEFSALIARNVDEVGATYKALQFHFHAPSEHHVSGRSYDLEMHLVHNISDDSLNLWPSELGGRNLAVVGFLFEVDDSAPANPFIDALRFDELNQPRNIDLVGLLGSQISSPLNYYTYKGSLTTPPTCGEIVNWFVMEQPLKITSQQLALITQHYAGNPEFAHGHGNNRNVQPLNGRIVRRGGVSCIEQLNYLWVYLGVYFAFNILICLVIKLTWKGPKEDINVKTTQYELKESNRKSSAQFQTLNVANAQVDHGSDLP